MKLHSAMIQNKFQLYFQPQYSMSDNRLTGFEALLRLEHPTLGILSPASFMPLAEATGFIAPLGNWVVKRACESISVMERLHLLPANARVSINVCAAQLLNHKFLHTIESALTDSGIISSRLEIEITESNLIKNMETAVNTINELKRMDIDVAIDDFGIGYSSLAYLRNLPVQRIKLDRSFLQDVPNSWASKEIVASLISLAHKLNLRVVAEGVEDILQWRFLKENNCDFAQGYFLGKAVSLFDL